jgi:hypothetical protein
MTQDMTPVSLNDPMTFVCGPDKECFNDCCRDLNQVLTPYDVLRLKNHLHLPSGAFLQTYTIRRTGPACPWSRSNLIRPQGTPVRS